jgi:hypothetical protein
MAPRQAQGSAKPTLTIVIQAESDDQQRGHSVPEQQQEREAQQESEDESRHQRALSLAEAEKSGVFWCACSHSPLAAANFLSDVSAPSLGRVGGAWSELEKPTQAWQQCWNWRATESAAPCRFKRASAPLFSQPNVQPPASRPLGAFWSSNRRGKVVDSSLALVWRSTPPSQPLPACPLSSNPQSDCPPLLADYSQPPELFLQPAAFNTPPSPSLPHNTTALHFLQLSTPLIHLPTCASQCSDSVHPALAH